MTVTTKNAVAELQLDDGVNNPTHQIKTEGAVMTSVPDTSTGWKLQPPSWAVQQACEELDPHEDGEVSETQILDRARQIAAGHDTAYDGEGGSRRIAGWQVFHDHDPEVASPIFDTADEAMDWIAALPTASPGLVVREVAPKPLPPSVGWATSVKVHGLREEGRPWAATAELTVFKSDSLPEVRILCDYELTEDGWVPEGSPLIDLDTDRFTLGVVIDDPDDAQVFGSQIIAAGQVLASIVGGAK